MNKMFLLGSAINIAGILAELAHGNINAAGWAIAAQMWLILAWTKAHKADTRYDQSPSGFKRS